MRKIKKSILLSLLVSIFGVTTLAVSSLAWFQLSSQPIQADLVTGSSEVHIDNVDGIKKEETVDPETGLPTVSDNTTRKNYDTSKTTVNTDAASEDLNFDVPSEGVGYYLIKKNPGGTYKYKYGDPVAAVAGSPLSNGASGAADTDYYTREASTAGVGYLNDGNYEYTYAGSGTSFVADAGNKYYPLTNVGASNSYAIKLNEDYATASRCSANSVQVSANDSFIVRRYTFVSENNKTHTVNEKQALSSAFSDITNNVSIDSNTKAVKVTTAGSYKVWFNYSDKTIGFENMTINSKGVNVRSAVDESSKPLNVERKARRNATSTSVYLAISASKVSSYTIKCNTNHKGDGDDWHEYTMTRVSGGVTYHGKLVYSVSFTDTYDGLGAMYFRIMNGGDQVEQQKVFGDRQWTGQSTYNGKIWEYGSSGWSTYTPDTAILLVGAATSWSLTDSSNYMSWDSTEGQHYFLNATFPVDGHFKIVVYNTWDYYPMESISSTGAGGFFTYSNNNDSIVRAAGTYNFYLKDGVLYTSFVEATGGVGLMYWKANGANHTTNTAIDGVSGYNDSYTSTSYGFTWDGTNSRYVYSGYFAADTLFVVYRPRGSNASTNSTYEYGNGSLYAENVSSYLGGGGNGYSVSGYTVPRIWFNTACAADIYFYPYRDWDQTIEIYKKSYTVTLDATTNGGSIKSGNITSYTFGTEQSLSGVTVNDPTGYSFKGWYTNPSGGTKVTSISATDYGNKTYYAQWDAKTSALTFDLNDGSGTVPTGKKATYGSAMPSYGESAPTRTGYTFAGFYDGEGGTGTKYYNANLSSAQNWDKDKTTGTTLYAKWDCNSYTLSWNFNDGSSSETPVTDYSSGSVAYGATIDYPTDGSMSKTGYTFNGWSPNPETMPASDTTIAAQWTAKTSALTFNLNGGSGTAPTNKTATYDSAMPTYGESAPTRTGYTFAGFYDGEGGTGTKYYNADLSSATEWDKNTTDGTTLYAKWDINSHKLVWNWNSGTTPAGAGTNYTAAGDVDYNDTITYPANNLMSRTGYTFTGWVSSPSGNPTKMPDSDLTITAQWEAITYTVAYNANKPDGVSAEVSNLPSGGTWTYDVTYSLGAAPTLTGYNFGGWYRDQSCTEVNRVGAAGASVSNLRTTEGTVTLYAKWTIKTTTITFNIGSGSGGDSGTIATYGSAMPTVSIPSQTLYKFGGYFTAADGGGQQYYGDDGTSAKNWDKENSTLTLYAYWITLYEINIYKNSGNGTDHVVYVTSGGDYYTNNTGTLKMTPGSSGANPISSPNQKRGGYGFEGYGFYDGDFGDFISEPYIDSQGHITSWALTQDAVDILLGNKDGYDDTYKLELYSMWAQRGSGWGQTNTWVDVVLDHKGGTKGSGVVTESKKDKIYSTEHSYIGCYFFNNIDNGAGNGYEYRNPLSSYADNEAIIPTKDGFTFAGYYTDEIYTESNKIIDGNGRLTQYAFRSYGNGGVTITLYAKWIRVYKVQLNNKGADLVQGTDFIYENYNENIQGRTGYYFDNACTLPISTIVIPVKTGYTFGGYYESEDGGNTLAANACIDSSGSILVGTTKFNNDTTILYAMWTPTSYTIVYTMNGGTSNPSNRENYTIETSTFSLVNPTKTGFTFTGWTGSNGEVPQTSVSIAQGSTGNKSYTANWRANTYTIAYNYASGSAGGVDPTSGQTYNVYVQLHAPTRAGYDFAGWTSSAGAGLSSTAVRGTTSSPSTAWDGTATTNLYFLYLCDVDEGTVTLTATWTPITYSITYAGMSAASFVDEQAATFSGNKHPDTATYDVAFELSKPTKTGYTFTGWVVTDSTTGAVCGTSSSSLTNTIPENSPYGASNNSYWFKFLRNTVSGSVTITATWSINTYSLTWDFDGGATSSNSYTTTGTYDYYQEITYPANNTMSKTNYYFTGWSSTPTYLTSALTITAQWRGPIYVIRLDNQGATNVEGVREQIYEYRLHGYYLDNDGYTNQMKYSPKTNPIGTLPEKTGYTFQGYYKATSVDQGGNVTGWGIQILSSTGYLENLSANEFNSDSVIYAKWDIITYTISYELNGGSVETPNPTSYTVESSAITLNNPTKRGYTFAGWTGTGLAQATITVTIPAGSHENKSYAATWNIITYNISYDYNGGSVETPNPTTYTVITATITLNNPTKTGHTFTGWSGTDLIGEANMSVTIPTDSIGDRSFVAHWTENIYTISLNHQSADSGHEGTQTIYLKYGVGYYSDSGCNSSLTVITRPQKKSGDDGYTFRGYFTETNGGGTPIIDEAGNVLTSSAAKTAFDGDPSETKYAFAKWVIIYYVSVDVKRGTTPDPNVTATTRFWHENSGRYYADQYGEKEMKNRDTYGTNGNNHINVVELAGYTLKGYGGWSPTDSTIYLDGDGYLITAGVTNSSALNPSAGHATVVALWRQKIYTLTLNNNGADSGEEGTPRIYEAYYDGTEWAEGIGDRDTWYSPVWDAGGYYLEYDNTSPLSNSEPFNPDKQMRTSDNAIDVPYKTGYDFGGYYDNQSFTGNPVIKANGYVYSSQSKPMPYLGDTILYAKWIVHTYTVTLDYANGSSDGSIDAEYDDSFSVSDPTRDGYAFLGWKSDTTGGFYGGSSSQNNEITSTTTSYKNATDPTYFLNLTAEDEGEVTLTAVWALTVRVYDSTGTYGSNFWYYSWGSGGSGDGWSSKMTSSNVGGKTVYSAIIDENCTGFAIATANNWETRPIVQTFDLSVSDLTNFSYFVLTGKLDYGSDHGDTGKDYFDGIWVKNINYSGATQRVRLFDTPAKISDSPYIYAFDNTNPVVNPSGNHTWGTGNSYSYGKKYYYPDHTAVTAMTQGEASNGLSYWYADIPVEFMGIIFTKQGGVPDSMGSDDAHAQTQDISLTGHIITVVEDEVTTYYSEYYVMTSNAIGDYGGKRKYTTAGTWSKYLVNLKLSYFIDDAHSSITEKAVGYGWADPSTVKYTANNSYNTEETIVDGSKSILYVFQRSGNYWYDVNTCITNQDEHDNNAVLTADISLYAKYVADMSKHRTFYIDTRNTNVQDEWGDHLHVTSTDGDTHLMSGYKVSNNLYRVTLPAMQDVWADGYKVVFHNDDNANGVGDNPWWSVEFDPQDYTNYSVIILGASSQNNRRSITVCVKTDRNSVIYGYAVIQKKVNSSWVEVKVMSNGDGTLNKFMYEQGVQIQYGTILRIGIWTDKATYLSGAEPSNANNLYQITNYWSYDVNETNYGLPYYLDTTGTDLKLRSDVGTQRYNFYVNGDNKVSIAMVPNFGNGYYIMNYSSTRGTGNYIASMKMTSSSNYSAYYNGFYAIEDQQIFIRSYIDAVDTMYTTEGTFDSGASISNGIITFSAQKYYDISVTNGVINISEYQPSAFFKLNRLDTSKKTTGAQIAAQSTGLVLEVKFHSTNTFASKVSLDVNNGLSKFVGVALYVTDTAGRNTLTSNGTTDTNIYAFLNTYRYKLSNDGIIHDQNNFTIPANSSASTYFYAYIIVDYISTTENGNYSTFEDDVARYNLAYYLKVYQPEA